MRGPRADAVDVSGPTLRLAVQYASERAAPERRQVRRWVRAALAELASHVPALVVPIGEAALTVRFVDDDEGRTLNRTFRGKDYATNVLTFAYGDDDTAPSDRLEGDIVICLPVLEAEAAAQRKPLAAHTAHLVVHGVLHAAGLDHETPDEADAMERLERRVLARFRIADPYAEERRDDAQLAAG